MQKCTRNVAFDIEKLCVQHGSRRVLDYIDLSVHHGEFLMLLGVNGAGKSTLLHALAGDITPNSGQIRLHQQPLSQIPLHEQAQYRAVLEQTCLPAHGLTTAQVLNTVNIKPPRHRDRYHTLINTLQLTTLLHRPHTHLSGGERARVGLARAIWQLQQYDHAGILLLDEPTAALDVAMQETVLSLCQQLAHEAHFAVVASVHDFNHAARYADRVAILHHGQLCAVGESAQTLTAERLSAVWGYPIERFHNPDWPHPIFMPRPRQNTHQRVHSFNDEI